MMVYTLCNMVLFQEGKSWIILQMFTWEWIMRKYSSVHKEYKDLVSWES